MAGLSHGVVNFHLETGEKLPTETLISLAAVYRLNGKQALEAVGPAVDRPLTAVLTADFHPAIGTPARLSAWCSRWGEAQSRPLYQDRCGSNDAQSFGTLEGICGRLIAEGGYPLHPARGLRVTMQGEWLDLLTMTAPYRRYEARATVLGLCRGVLSATLSWGKDCNLSGNRNKIGGGRVLNEISVPSPIFCLWSEGCACARSSLCPEIGRIPCGPRWTWQDSDFCCLTPIRG